MTYHLSTMHVKSRLRLACLILCGCDSSPREPPPPKPEKPEGKLELVAVPEGKRDGPSYIAAQLAKARSEDKQLLVYVGATWCEPCTHFHRAAQAGQLDQAFPGVRLLEFDFDKHGEMLRDSDCLSKMIPLFAVPDQDGHCSARRVAGAIKGPGAVDFLRPKVRGLLD